MSTSDMILTIDLDLSPCPFLVLQQYDYAFALMKETPQFEEPDETFFFSLSSDQEYAFHIWIDGINALLNKPVSTGPEVIKLFSCTTQLSTKFQLLINIRIPTNKKVSCFKSLRCCIYHANKC